MLLLMRFFKNCDTFTPPLTSITSTEMLKERGGIGIVLSVVDYETNE